MLICLKSLYVTEADLNSRNLQRKGRSQGSIGGRGMVSFPSDWLTASFLSLSLIQSLKACIFGTGSKDCGPRKAFRSLTDLLNAAHQSLFPFKNKWTTLMVQMALFPITGLGGFQSSCRNILALTSDNYLVACDPSLSDT